MYSVRVEVAVRRSSVDAARTSKFLERVAPMVSRRGKKTSLRRALSGMGGDIEDILIVGGEMDGAGEEVLRGCRSSRRGDLDYVFLS